MFPDIKIIHKTNVHVRVHVFDALQYMHVYTYMYIVHVLNYWVGLASL